MPQSWFVQHAAPPRVRQGLGRCRGLWHVPERGMGAAPQLNLLLTHSQNYPVKQEWSVHGASLLETPAIQAEGKESCSHVRPAQAHKHSSQVMRQKVAVKLRRFVDGVFLHVPACGSLRAQDDCAIHENRLPVSFEERALHGLLGIS